MINYIKTSGKSNGVFGYKIKTNYESLLLNLFIVSKKSNGFGIEIEYIVVKDYCIEKKLDHFEMFRIMKRILGEVSNG